MEEVCEAVAAAARELAAEGLVLGTAGNLSARDGDRIAITPTGARLETVRGEEIAVVDLDGELVAGPLAPSSELGLHLGVYRRYDAGAVVHTHAPTATALSCVLSGEVPCVHYGMLALGGAVPIAPYATFGTEALADGVCDALDGHLAALMANHGTVTWGTGLDHAVENTRLLEWACTVYWRAASLGTPRAMSAEQLRDVVDAVVARGYGAVKPA